MFIDCFELKSDIYLEGDYLGNIELDGRSFTPNSLNGSKKTQTINQISENVALQIINRTNLTKSSTSPLNPLWVVTRLLMTPILGPRVTITRETFLFSSVENRTMDLSSFRKPRSQTPTTFAPYAQGTPEWQRCLRDSLRRGASWPASGRDLPLGR